MRSIMLLLVIASLANAKPTHSSHSSNSNSSSHSSSITIKVTITIKETITIKDSMSTPKDTWSDKAFNAIMGRSKLNPPVQLSPFDY